MTNENTLGNSITAAAKKDYKEFEKAISGEFESKMKNYLSGFNDFLQKNAFKKEE